MCRYCAATLSVIVLLHIGCDRLTDAPRVDPRYSESLTVLSGGRERGSDAASTVGLIRVFRDAGGTVAEVEDVAQGEMTFESRERAAIDRVLLALRTLESTADAPCDLEGRSWVLVAYDSNLPRVGVVRLYICGDGVDRVVGVRPVGDSAIMYSREAVAVLPELGIR